MGAAAMTLWRKLIGPLVAANLLVSVGFAQAVSLDLPADSDALASQTEALSSYLLPLGAFRNGEVPSRTLEGKLRQSAWKIDQPGQTTLEILSPLREQIRQQGFEIIFECDTADCGGFDFRFATTVLPEPAMHVDLGDFRFLSAQRGAEGLSLMVSRSSSAGFVQLIHIGPPDAAPITLPNTPLPASAETPPPTAQTAVMGDFGAALVASGSVTLGDIVFPSGSANLSDENLPSLQNLAGWMEQNPAMTVAIIGHTDASGALEANIALSRKRAEAVRQRLIAKYAISPNRVEAQGVGYLAPVASNLTEGGREKNRRVEVMVTSTQLKP